jgi:hypothetical protein
MRGKVPRHTKERVIHDWIQGLRRDKIAKKNNLGDGTVTGIIKEASQQEEYHDMIYFRQLAVLLKDNSLGPLEVGFAVRIMKIMEQNDINVDQIEALVSEFATYCYEDHLSFGEFVQIARECLSLADKLPIRIQEIPGFIVGGKNLIGQLEEQRQESLREMQKIRKEQATLITEITKYGGERQLIEYTIKIYEGTHIKESHITLKTSTAFLIFLLLLTLVTLIPNLGFNMSNSSPTESIESEVVQQMQEEDEGNRTLSKEQQNLSSYEGNK